MADTKQLPNPGPMVVSTRMKTLYSVLIFVGLLAFVLSLLQDSTRAWHSYLTSYFYFVSLGLGGLFFAAIQHMTKAGWSVNLRRLSESLTAFIPFTVAGGLILLIFGAKSLFSWLDPQVVATDYLVQHKQAYLNEPFLWIRTLIFFAVWIVFARILVGRSIAQDQTGDESLTHKLVPASIAFVLLFALTYSFFSVDLLMSLEPHWFSTIFGVYAFAGLFQSTIAVIILMILYFLKKGQLTGYVDENHLHDLGKFLFAFTVFWAYIAFSQYMLIWYANIPEETIFYIPRVSGDWLYVSGALIMFKFIVPFFALLPRWAKRTPNHLAAVCILLLVMQYVDLYWLVYPNLSEDVAPFGFQEIAVFLGFLGLFMFAVTRFLSRHSIVAIKDPRMDESLHHHVTY